MPHPNQAQIEAAAAAFLNLHHPSLEIPIPIEDIVELSLKLNIVTHKDLFKTLLIDGFLSSDLTELHINEEHYMGSTNRYRFTLAHEVGHLVLHSSASKMCKSIEDWKAHVLGSGPLSNFRETEANEFAGCVLMPKEKAIQSFEIHKQQIIHVFKTAGVTIPPDKFLIDYLALRVAQEFDVSEQVAAIRLKNLIV